MRVWIALAVVLASAPSASGQGQAPNKQSVVAAVMAAHPNIDRCDEAQRGSIVDWTATRLNEGRAGPWGRKSRNSQGTDLNTDALTFARDDAKFEIVDVIAGAPPCNSTWDGDGHAFKAGENGFWVPPQLGAEPGGPIDPPPTKTVTRAEMDAAIHSAIVELHTTLWGEVAFSLSEVRSLRDRDVAELNARIDARPVDTAGLAAAIEAALANYEINGKTRVSFGHQHVVQLQLGRKK